MGTGFKLLAALAASAVAAMLSAVSSAAQTGAESSSAMKLPSATAAAEASAPAAPERIAYFVATAIPAANFVSQASRMAIAHSQNAKLRALAGELAKEQNAVAVSLTRWVNVSSAVVTRSSPSAAQTSGAAKLSAPRLLPVQASTLQRLSAAQGASFDSLYVSAVREALAQLRALFGEFAQSGPDPGLKAVAVRDLPKVEQALSALGRL